MTPDEGRALWAHLISDVSVEKPFSPALHHVLESVLVDIVDKRMELSDTFAITIGNRIAFLSKALEETS